MKFEDATEIRVVFEEPARTLSDGRQRPSYRDALTFTPAEWQKMSRGDLVRAQQERYRAWEAALDEAASRPESEAPAAEDALAAAADALDQAQRAVADALAARGG